MDDDRRADRSKKADQYCDPPDTGRVVNVDLAVVSIVVPVVAVSQPDDERCEHDAHEESRK